MKNLFLLIILICFIIFFSSCTISHPLSQNNEVKKGEGITVLEDISCSFGPGISAFKIKEGNHIYVYVETYCDIEIFHDENCPSHEIRLMDRAKQNQDRRDGF